MSIEDLRTFLFLRRCWFGPVVVALVSVVTVVVGHHEVANPVPIAEGVATLPVWRLLSLIVAIMPAVLLHSPLGELESAAVREYWRVQHLYLAGSVVLYLGSFTVVAWLGLGGDTALIALRAMIAWLGLALLSGRMFGWSRSWLLPLVSVAILLFWGMDTGSTYVWWEFSARPHDDWKSAVVAGGLALLGAAIYWARSWRRHLLHPLRRARSLSR
ncbi:hypothetical protein EF847_11360 [Actinobacteria bacterium YIM 96077]|uniref:Uncharacterized protein n=1 Tax=Phytoactinopolyspora halophila TaxID=1981511 RepID=A0A329QYR3_9ACTN|nr:hypothetical protein [Phytoactinopolyspora halophila]AYY13207.1 hypothetical protein EF847_11360 [Actinobacteria bacterium YIM 96077]RAW17554.1 hypothetical protein DPM12_06060 [Phytoactinopolyspora halophila]